MADQNSDDHPIAETEVAYQIRPDALMEELGIKKDAYYAYLKHLGFKAEKDLEGKAYLNEAQANSIRELRSHVSAGGKIEGFAVSNSDAALTRSESGGVDAWSAPVPDVEVNPVQGLDLQALYREASELAGQRLTAGEQVVLAMASQMGYEDLHPDARAKVDNVRAATSPKFNPQQIAADLLSQCRQQQPEQTQALA
ncbi:hypothetical protein BH23CYA1_BH23CYA1_07170 [soil metagenome]